MPKNDCSSEYSFIFVFTNLIIISRFEYIGIRDLQIDKIISISKVTLM